MKFLSLLLFLFLIDMPLCHAYLIRTTGNPSECVNTPYFQSQYTEIQSLTIDAAKVNNLSAGQYLALNPRFLSGASNQSYSAVIDCDNLGPAQTRTRLVMKNTSSNTHLTINESAIVNISETGLTPSQDKDPSVDIFPTNTPGVFIFFQGKFYNDTVELAIPLSFEGTSTFSSSPYYRITVWGHLLVNKDFKGIPPGTTVTPLAGKFDFEMYDELENPSTRLVQTNTTTVDTSTGGIAMISTCNYSLSDNGIVDFGDQNPSKVTNSRVTTLKKPLTLYMKDCYGVNKVKTYITNATTTLENGLLLGNTQTTNAATNVAIGINVAASSAKNSENNGSPMYMDGSNPLEWEFGNQYTVDPISKEIPLDVFLLSSGGEPTTGDFRATATIMMDFI